MPVLVPLSFAMVIILGMILGQLKEANRLKKLELRTSTNLTEEEIEGR